MMGWLRKVFLALAGCMLRGEAGAWECVEETEQTGRDGRGVLLFVRVREADAGSLIKRRLFFPSREEALPCSQIGINL